MSIRSITHRSGGPAIATPTRRRLGAALYAALGCWATGVLWLSSLTPQEIPENAFLLGDKAVHVLVFALGGWLAARAVRVSRPGLPVTAALALAVAAIAAFGVLDETVQTFTPGRTGGDLRDWVADVIGAALGAALSALVGRRRGHPDRGPA